MIGSFRPQYSFHFAYFSHMKLLFGNSGLMELVKLLLEYLMVAIEDPGCAGYADNKILAKLKDFDAD